MRSRIADKRGIGLAEPRTMTRHDDTGMARE